MLLFFISKTKQWVTFKFNFFNSYSRFFVLIFRNRNKHEIRFFPRASSITHRSKTKNHIPDICFNLSFKSILLFEIPFFCNFIISLFQINRVELVSPQWITLYVQTFLNILQTHTQKTINYLQHRESNIHWMYMKFYLSKNIHGINT